MADIIAYAGIVVAIIAVVPLYLDLFLRWRSGGNRVFLYRFKAEPFWFLVVKCVKDPIQDCRAFLDSKNLIIKDTDKAPIYARPIALDESIWFGISQSDTNDISKGVITVKDGKKTLSKMKFKDIPIHNPRERVTAV